MNIRNNYQALHGEHFSYIAIVKTLKNKELTIKSSSTTTRSRLVVLLLKNSKES